MAGRASGRFGWTIMAIKLRQQPSQMESRLPAQANRGSVLDIASSVDQNGCMMPTRERMVLFLGSGFSVDLGLPVTSKLQDQILEVNSPPEEVQREAFISRQISSFWREVFGWTGSRTRPALEDHFTQIDLAANSGHYLGMIYGPKKLRALRRMTIHRIFTLLNIEPTAAPHIDALIHRLLSGFDLSIVTTNWDIMAERCLERLHAPFFYSRQSDSRQPPQPVTGIPVWKLHGSGNWGYCDVCRNLITSEITLGKTTVRFGWLLEAEDFRLFRGGGKIAKNLGTAFRECVGCGGRTAVRVATFSYRKHLDVPFFQSIWDEARESLRSAERWLFIGYSMPEADVEIRHLLKAAELSHRIGTRPMIDIVLKGDDSAGLRYRRLFGRTIRGISNAGIERWVGESLSDYCD